MMAFEEFVFDSQVTLVFPRCITTRTGLSFLCHLEVTVITMSQFGCHINSTNDNFSSFLIISTQTIITLFQMFGWRCCIFCVCYESFT